MITKNKYEKMTRDQFIAENLNHFMKKHEQYLNSLVQTMIDNEKKTSCEWKKILKK